MIIYIKYIITQDDMPTIVSSRSAPDFVWILLMLGGLDVITRQVWTGQASLYQKGGPGDCKGLLVDVSTAEEQQDIAIVLLFVELQQLRQLSELHQVWREL